MIKIPITLSEPSILRQKIILIAVTLLIYANSLFNGFVWDDHYIIVNNPIIRDLANIPKFLVSADAVFLDDIAYYYRPISRLSYLFDYSLFGLQPAGYHLVNILIHLGNVLLLFALGQRLFTAQIASFAAALLLAVHPLMTESVNFISGRNNALATTFVLSTVLLFIRGVESQRRIYNILVGITFFCGLMVKEIGFMVLPFLVLWVPYAANCEHMETSLKQRVKALIPCFIACIVYFLLRKAALPHVFGGGFGGIDLWQRISQNFYSIPLYLALIIFPAQLRNYYTIPADYMSQWAIITFAWLLIILLIIQLLRRGSKPLIFGLLWFVVNYIPISQIIPFTSAPIAERYIYLPSIGIWLMAGYGVSRLCLYDRHRSLIISGLTILIVILALTTLSRNRAWRDDVSLFSSLVKIDPSSVYGLYNLGGAYASRKEYDNAKVYFLRAIELEPSHSKALNQLGNIDFLQGSLMEAEYYYTKAIKYGKYNAEAYYNLAMIMAQTGRSVGAIRNYELFLARVPPEYQEMIPEVKNKIKILQQQLIKKPRYTAADKL